MFASSRIAALLILSCSVNVVVRCDQHLCPTGYSRSACLDDIECKYLLCWKVNWPDETITFVSKVATTGWIGFGVSPTGMMSNSDVVIGWVANGQGYLKVRARRVHVRILLRHVRPTKLRNFTCRELGKCEGDTIESTSS